MKKHMYVKFQYWYIAFPKAVSVYSPSDYMWECLIIQISIILLALHLLCWDEPLLFVVFIILLMFEFVLFNNIVCVWEWVYVWALCVCVWFFPSIYCGRLSCNINLGGHILSMWNIFKNLNKFQNVLFISMLSF